MDILYALEKIRTPFWNGVMSAVTQLGGEVIFIVAAVVVFWCVSKWEGYYLMTIAFCGTVLNQFLKLICRVPRPWVQDPNFTIVESARAEATGYSFPSGHTQNAIGLFGGMARWGGRRWVRLGLTALALVIAFSRMYLGVHTPADVGVSLVLAAALVLGLYPLMRRAQEKPRYMGYVLAAMLVVSGAFVVFVEAYGFSADTDAENLASGIGKALCEKLVALGAQVYALDRNKADIEGLSAFVETDLSDKGSIDAAFGVLPQVIDRFFGVAGLSGARTSYWLTFTVNFIANKYMTDTYLEKRIPSGGSIAYVTSCGGLMWEKWRKEYVKVMDCKTWDEMVAFMKSVSPKDGVGVMAYTLSKRAMNYYTSLKAVELGKRGIRVNALLPGSTDTGMKKEFEKMAGGQDNLIKENGGAGRLATPQEMADPLLFLNSDMAAYVSGMLKIADMLHNSEKTQGFSNNQ